MPHGVNLHSVFFSEQFNCTHQCPTHENLHHGHHKWVLTTREQGKGGVRNRSSGETSVEKKKECQDME